jgi:tRNA threonylcarbamoyladenosine modification (KEOPS) complex  Pcc1 subunit
LVMSLTCALLATLLQQWARRYITITQPPRYSPHKRAPIRAFFADGVERFHLPSSVEMLPALLHLSLFLFFIGLVIFLFNIHHTVFSVVVWWVGLAAAGYMWITVMPIFRHDSPYYAPLSSSAWLFFHGILYTVHKIRYSRWFRLFGIFGHDTAIWLRPITHHKRFLGGMSKSVQEIGSGLSAEINSRIVIWTFGALDEDQELEQFFASIPGFCSSKVVDFPKRVSAELDSKFSWALYEFLRRTLTSSLLLEADKKRRLVICVKAADQAHLSSSIASILSVVFRIGVDVILRSVDIGRTLSLKSGGDTGLCAQAIIAGIIATVPKRDDRWIALTKDQLGISENVLRDYLTHGDSVLLANLIHIIRTLLRLCLDNGQDKAVSLFPILQHISKFDIQNTLPGLQHDFCDLWNEIVQEARKTGGFYYPCFILQPIRHFYIALHQGTDCAPTAFDASTQDDDYHLRFSTSYPLCNIPGHQSQVNNAAGTAENTHPSTIAPPTIQPYHTVLNTITPSTAPDMPLIPASTPDQTRIHLSEESSLHGVPDATPII